jgi:hypothetical protein
MRRTTTSDLRPDRHPPGFAVFVVLSLLAVAGHLAQVGHFLAVPHLVGADGKLHHACAASGCAVPDEADSGAEDPEPPAPDEGESCPLQPPGLAPGPPALPTAAPTALAVRPLLVPIPSAPAGPVELLAFAPKHSPPGLRSR